MNYDQGAILVVDDNESNRDLLSRRLQRQGYTTFVAEDGLQAMEIIRAQNLDLVLLDIMMPEMDGYAVLAALKADPALRHLPVIMISALDEIDSIVRCIELGAEDYLHKPFNPTLLRARIGASLEKKRLRDQEQAYLRAMRQELELARRTQAEFLPAELPHVPGWEIAAAFYPAREVAGDFYDAFPLPGNRLALVLADVCDKGVGAALFMVLTRTLIRAFAEQAGPTTIDALNAVMLTNAYIARHHHRSQTHTYATLFFGVLELGSGLLTYINGGHPAPLLLGGQGVKAALEATGPAVGMMADSHFAPGQVLLQPGDCLLAYTDGVTEARNARGALFGEARLLELLGGGFPAAAAAMRAIEQGVYSYLGHTTLVDDITMLAVRRIES